MLQPTTIGVFGQFVAKRGVGVNEVDGNEEWDGGCTKKHSRYFLPSPIKVTHTPR